MARIAGINIPQNKVVSIALTYIHGIGLYSSKKICESPTPYTNTKVITKLARKTPANTANPLSLSRHEVRPAILRLSGRSLNRFFHFSIRFFIHFLLIPMQILYHLQRQFHLLAIAYGQLDWLD